MGYFKRIQHSDSTFSQGFALVELLVIIAIILVLASILTPTLATSLNAARTTICTNNQRQLMGANLHYTTDYNGFLLNAIADKNINPHLDYQAYWWYALYAGNYSEKKLYVCPADILPNDWCFMPGQPEYGGVGAQFPISYGYSYVLGNSYLYRQVVNGALSIPLSWAAPKRLSHFRNQSGPRSNSSKAFVFFDYANCEQNLRSNNKCSGNSAFGTGRISARHNGGVDINDQHFPLVGSSNFSFIDGHVKVLQAPYSLSAFSGYFPFSSDYDYAGGF